jgi:hypothetical protein
VQAGWGSINLEKVVAHYEALGAEEDRKALESYKKILEEQAKS